MPWGAIVQIVAQLLDLFLRDKARRDSLKLQMFDFAKKHDKDSIEGNLRLREEYARIMSELNKPDEDKKVVTN